MNWIKLFVVLLLASQLSGCFLTKVVSVPMRAVGAVISIIPVAGNTAHDAIDGAADVVDDVPI
ncbi:DUF6726 family protein [Desulfuromonas acetexigens]|jgi:hypothetical protein|uniref:Uncharacterized protein n=1 Tax=Trichloromonas acetexigens TaxID=38815 RepID=A0A550J696_9BACT|nr:DUF6726 family protein [Desulfuromonas acetexigens]TRO78778.1 hypothetical protein FL622_14985 [Desulfuromonas acetexigens]